MKAQRVCRVKAIPVAARATRISALWLGVAALTLAVAALPAEAGKKQKPAKAPDESIVDVDNKQPMIVVVSIGQQKVDVYRGTSLVTTSAVSTGTAQHPTFIGAFSIMEAAEAALAAGDVNTAAQAFGEALQKDAENARAAAGLAKCYIKTGDLTRAEQTLALVPPAKADSAPVASARASLELARKAADTGDVDSLRAKLAANPKDTQSRFDLALALNAKGDRQGALDELLTIIRKDRAFNDDAARKQLLQLFDAWGVADPATISGRQRLSSLLFA